MYSSQTNISSTQKQIWRPFLCRRNFLKKTNCFKSLGEKRLQKVDFIEYIFLPQNFLRRVCLQKPQGRECDREARGKNMVSMVENSHYSIGTLRSSTLLLQYIHWFFVELLQLEALNSPFFFGRFPLNFLANSKMEKIEIKRINNCAGVYTLHSFCANFEVP